MAAIKKKRTVTLIVKIENCIDPVSEVVEDVLSSNLALEGEKVKVESATKKKCEKLIDELRY